MKLGVPPHKVWFTLEEIASRWEVLPEIVHQYVWSARLLRYAIEFDVGFPSADGFLIGEDAENLENPIKFGIGEYLFLNVAFLRDSQGKRLAGKTKLEFVENFNGDLMQLVPLNDPQIENSAFEVQITELKVPLVEVERFEKVFPSIKTTFPLHSTALLEVLTKTIDEFWTEGSAQGPQKKEVVVTWLLENFAESHELSRSMAIAIDTISRPQSHKKKNPR
tara:strand:- start:9694 stop:10356 length:663 start_codon:yes stop_codon:yes gene_type:complete